MKESPILFSTPMVKAILEGRKTQTRRVVKFSKDIAKAALQQAFLEHGYIFNLGSDFLLCPYGMPGDRLWVKETFYALGHWLFEYDGKEGKSVWSFNDCTEASGETYRYIDNPPARVAKKRGKHFAEWYKRPSIFMPRKASRILLEVVNVRIERLQSISEQDAIAEGVLYIREGGNHGPIWEFSGYLDYQEKEACRLFDSAIESYKSLWQSINGAESWDLNTWVWAIEFKQVTA